MTARKRSQSRLLRVYAGPGPTRNARRRAYRTLFEDRVDVELIASIRDATQRGWVPGSERFRS
jgi:putative transposase